MVKTIFMPVHRGNNCDLFDAALYNFVSKTVRLIAGKFYSVLSDDDIDDMINDVSLKILENLKKVDLEKNFYGWVYKTCRNTVYSRAKAMSKRRSRVIDLDEGFDNEDEALDPDRWSVMADEACEADRRMLEKEFEQKFWKTIDRLNPEQRKVAILLFEGTPYKEMARILDCSENTLKTRVCRTRQALLKMGIAA